MRDSHAGNHGKIFAWRNAPSTGHPGDAFGCRCVAVPYGLGLAEELSIELQDVSDEGAQWTSLDFINHYFFGDGVPVALRDVGHLEAVVASYRRLVLDDFTRLPSQIAKERARVLGNLSKKGSTILTILLMWFSALVTQQLEALIEATAKPLTVCCIWRVPSTFICATVFAIH